MSALCIYLAVRRVEWARFAESLRLVRAVPLLAGAVAYVASVTVAGLRWRTIVRPVVTLPSADAIEIVFAGSLGNVVVPRLGDLLRAVLTGRRGHAATGRVLGSLIVERFADVLMLVILAAALSTFVMFPVAIRIGVYTFVAVAAAALATVWLAADRLPMLMRQLVSVVSPRVASKIADLLQTFATGLRESALSGQLPAALVLSVCVWALAGASIILTIRAFSLPAPWYAGLFVLLVINLGGAIPSSPGSLGVYHYLVVLALSVWSSDSSAALGFAVVNHALGLTLMAVCGAVALWRQGMGLKDLSPSWVTSAA